MQKKTEQQVLWEGIRIMKVFKITPLLFCSKIKTSKSKARSATEYVNYLVRAGFIKECFGGGYILLKNTGPLAPMICKDSNKQRYVFDENTNKKYEITPLRKSIKKESKYRLLTLIKEKPEFTVNDTLAVFKYNSAKTTLKRLEKEGMVEKLGEVPKDKTKIGVYCITSIGKEFVNSIAK